jgi:hypothetical protein
MSTAVVSRILNAVPSSVCPHRRVLLALESLLAVAGLAGTIQLIAGVYTPPLDSLPPGLSSWVLPGLWLFATVPLPAAIAAWLLYRRSPYAPTAVLVGAATLALEVGVQIPFIGLNWLQAIFGGLAVVLAALAVHARQHGWGVARQGRA